MLYELVNYGKSHGYGQYKAHLAGNTGAELSIIHY